MNTLKKDWLSTWAAGTEMDKLFGSLFDPDFFSRFNIAASVEYPEDQYWDKGNILHVEIPLAGYNKESISIDIDKDDLVLTVKKSEPIADVKYIARGIRRKELLRRWYLNDAFERNKITSSFEDGMLRISLPLKAKPEKVEKTKIEIK